MLSLFVIVCGFNRDGSVTRSLRRCRSDLGYVSQETMNSDFSSSSCRPCVGRCKKLASGVCTVNNVPGVDGDVDCLSKLQAVVRN